MTVYGYARVSTDGQTLAVQDAQLRAAGVAKTYSEKVSGATSDRPQLAKLLKRLDNGDVLVVTCLDRLARSTRDLLNILDTVAKAGAGFKSLADAWADTTTPHGRLMLIVLGGLAEFERELIRARTGEGRKRAQARGVKFGRPPKLYQPISDGKRWSGFATVRRRPILRGHMGLTRRRSGASIARQPDGSDTDAALSATLARRQNPWPLRGVRDANGKR
jgi:DNA invertase Pin-like site-specific DNA recombinase